MDWGIGPALKKSPGITIWDFSALKLVELSQGLFGAGYIDHLAAGLSKWRWWQQLQHRWSFFSFWLIFHLNSFVKRIIRLYDIFFSPYALSTNNLYLRMTFCSPGESRNKIASLPYLRPWWAGGMIISGG